MQAVARTCISSKGPICAQLGSPATTPAGKFQDGTLVPKACMWRSVPLETVFRNDYAVLVTGRRKRTITQEHSAPLACLCLSIQMPSYPLSSASPRINLETAAPCPCKENNFHICSCILTVLLYSCRNKGVKCPFSSLKKF